MSLTLCGADDNGSQLRKRVCRATTWETSAVINYAKLFSQWEQVVLDTAVAPFPIRLNVLYNEPYIYVGVSRDYELPPRPPHGQRCGTLQYLKYDILLSSAQIYDHISAKKTILCIAVPL